MLKMMMVLGLMTALLTGCQAATPMSAPIAPIAAATRAAQAPRTLPPTYRTLQAANSGNIFGFRYTLQNDRIGPPVYSTVFSDRWQSVVQFGGKGTLERASYNRLIYQVPEDQVLVINQIQGNGSVSLNGYPVYIPQANTHYVFGSGETVVFAFSPVVSHSENLTHWGVNFRVLDHYQPISISGYTIDPALLGGTASAKAK